MGIMSCICGIAPDEPFFQLFGTEAYNFIFQNKCYTQNMNTNTLYKTLYGSFLPTRTLVNMYLIWSTCTLVKSFLFWVKPYLSIKFQESNYVFIFGM